MEEILIGLSHNPPASRLAALIISMFFINFSDTSASVAPSVLTSLPQHDTTLLILQCQLTSSSSSLGHVGIGVFVKLGIDGQKAGC